MWTMHYSTTEIWLMLLRESLRAAAPFLTAIGGLVLGWAVVKWPTRALPPE